ncbi:MAG: MFS transporter [Gammaproteobacteria bacterium]|nr:MFS transporter [Gammaproteobacteria bacterium]
MPLVQAPSSATRVTLVAGLALFISYVDRGNLATAATLIQQEFALSPERLGVLLSAFYFTYVAAMVPAGWLAERYGARQVLAVGLVIWSLATFASGFAASFIALLLLRLLLGLGESVSFPCMSRLLVIGVPTSQLSIANGVVAFGYLIGPAVGTLAGGLLMAEYGWRPVFVLFGALSLLWLLPWRRLVVHEPRPPAGSVDSGPPLRRILGERALWGTSLGLFSMNYSYYLILAWLPAYLVSARGFSLASMATVAAGAYLINALAALGSGWAIDRWIGRGHSASLTHKSIMAAYHLFGIVCMIGIVTLPVAGAIACLYFYQLIIGIGSPGTYAIPQILAGPTAAARWVGVQNMCGNLAGLIAPAVTGFIIGATGEYDRAFLLAAAINVLGLVGWVVLLPKIAPIDWRHPSNAHD